MVVMRARHQRVAGLSVPLQELANEKILTYLDTYQACVPARVELTLPSFLYNDTHTFPAC